MTERGDLLMEKDPKTMPYFKIFADKYELLEDLTDQQKGKLLDMLCRYAFFGEMPELEPGCLRMAFRSFKASIDAGLETYIKICERNRENGSNGGRPKKKTKDSKKTQSGFSETQSKPVGFSETQSNPLKPIPYQEQDQEQDQEQSIPLQEHEQAPEHPRARLQEQEGYGEREPTTKKLANFPDRIQRAFINGFIEYPSERLQVAILCSSLSEKQVVDLITETKRQTSDPQEAERRLLFAMQQCTREGY